MDPKETERLLKIIKAKLRGKAAKLTEHVEPRQAEVVDLMERLRQSLQGSAGAGRGTKARKMAKAQETGGRRKEAGRKSQAPSRTRSAAAKTSKGKRRRAA